MHDLQGEGKCNVRMFGNCGWVSHEALLTLFISIIYALLNKSAHIGLPYDWEQVKESIEILRLKLNQLVLKSNQHMYKSTSLTRNSNLRAKRNIFFTRSQQCISMHILGRSASSLDSDDIKMVPDAP